SPTSYQAAPSRACEIEFYGFTSCCQANIQEKPFLFKPLALVGKMQLRRGAAFRPIVECWRG
ncbi:hypothetical protein, partial [Pseudomonas monteilii]|uniref:hypothetical protein n=1 Tax=Pseudomonas monteilii TaxID=76759 RepID=UPI001F1A067A